MSLSVSSDSSQESSVTSGQRPNSSPSPLLETFCYTWTGPSSYWTPFCSPPASQRANWRAVCFLRKESHSSKTEDRKSKDKARDMEQDEIRWMADVGWQNGSGKVRKRVRMYRRKETKELGMLQRHRIVPLTGFSSWPQWYQRGKPLEGILMLSVVWLMPTNIRTTCKNVPFSPTLNRLKVQRPLISTFQ